MPKHLGNHKFSGITTLEQELRLKHQAPVPTGTDTGFGRLYVDDSDGYLHFIDAYGADTQITAGGGKLVGDTGIHTEEALTFPVDYNDGYSVDPPSGTKFGTQAAIDNYLTSQGATAFKHLDRAYRSIPNYIDHHVTLALSAGIHRPSGDPENASASWQLSDLGWFVTLGYGVPGTGANIGVSGVLEIVGPTINEYLSVVASSSVPLSIDSFDTGSGGNPSITFTGTPFDGYNLRGRYAILDTDKAYLIHDHTSSVLYVTDTISDVPTTCWVGRPSAILRNSIDDISNLSSGSLSISGQDGTGTILLTDFAVENFGGNSIVVVLGVANMIKADRLVVDDLSVYDEFAIAPNGRAFQNSNIAVCGIRLTSCAYVAPVPLVAGGDGVGYFAYAGAVAQISLFSCYFGPNKGLIFQGWRVSMQKTVFLGQILYGLHLKSCIANFPDYGSKKNEIRNSVTGLVLDGSQSFSFASKYNNINIMATGNTGPGVTVSGGARVQIGLFTDGGGNLDVGIQLDGPNAYVDLDTATDITGANGDIRMADGTIISLTDLDTDDYSDVYGNVIRRV